jgi:hypothetical protein
MAYAFGAGRPQCDNLFFAEHHIEDMTFYPYWYHHPLLKIKLL